MAAAPVTTLFPNSISCALQCGPLYDANGGCVPPAAPSASALVYDLCLCSNKRLTAFSTTTAGVCDNACPSDTNGLSSIRDWYTAFCALAQSAARLTAETTTSASKTNAPASSTSSTSASSTSSASTATGGGGPTTLPASTSEGDSGGGLSSGAKAGIGIGVALGVVFASLLLLLALRRYRGKRLGKAKGEGHADLSHPRFPELDGNARSELEGETSISTSHRRQALQRPDPESGLQHASYPWMSAASSGTEWNQSMEQTSSAEQHPFEGSAAPASVAQYMAAVDSLPAQSDVSDRATGSPATGSQPTAPSLLPAESASTSMSQSGVGDGQVLEGGDELTRLMAEHAMLERRRQTLLQLQRVEEQQELVRSRISAVQQERQNPREGGGVDE
ncbi:hypothetical protein GQ53DRAFT_835140 [Thozetella sp. PMI_491]|nr:hypothetical protein GQ53DRAFT_835140 [Thozetella sp. PMI_491]